MKIRLSNLDSLFYNSENHVLFIGNILKVYLKRHEQYKTLSMCSKGSIIILFGTAKYSFRALLGEVKDRPEVEAELFWGNQFCIAAILWVLPRYFAKAPAFVSGFLL